MYKQFNKESRIDLATLLRANHSTKECAILLNFSKRSVNREIKRNMGEDGIYKGIQAHKKYLNRRKQSKKKYRIIENNKLLEKQIIQKLEKRDSPEQIAGQLNLKNKKQIISHISIYNWIYETKPELKKYLRSSHKNKFRRKKGTKAREKQREEAKIRRINKRPEIVEKKIRLGDWEGDTIIGSDRTKRLLTHNDRKSGYGMIDKLDIVSAEIVKKQIIKRFQKIDLNKKYTITYDNGSEFGKEDKFLEKQTKMKIYRAFPYHSWERGSNENFNGLVRDFFPKGTDFGKIDYMEIKKIERILNHRPRKRLNFLTPYEVFVKGKRVRRFKV